MPTQNIFDLVDTWNNGATTFTAIKMDVADTASAAASLLMDLKVGGASRFKFTKGGAMIVAPVNSSTPCLQLGAANGNILMTSRFGKFYFGGGSDGDTTQSSWFIDAQIVTMSGRSNAIFGFSSSAGDASATVDTTLTRDAAGVLGVRGSSTTTAAAMSFYTYGASPPAAPAASIVRLYADTSGGKIRLMAVFPSGVAQQIAIEP